MVSFIKHMFKIVMTYFDLNDIPDIDSHIQFYNV